MDNLLSYSSVKLDLFSRDGSRLKSASGFVVEAGDKHYIVTNWLACYRKVIETTASLLEQLLPKHIHAMTPRGFELKLALFVLAISFSYPQVATWLINRNHFQGVVTLQIYEKASSPDHTCCR